MIDDERRLADIVDAAERIALYSGGGRAKFDDDDRTQVRKLHHLQIIGEAVDPPKWLTQ